MRSLSKITLCLTAFLMVGTIASVSAAFNYAAYGAETSEKELTFQVALFDWEGSEVLPDNVQGEDHQTLIDLILNSEAGLNTSGSYLNQQIDDRKSSFWGWDTYGSMDVYDATQMASIFKTETSGLTFLLEFPKNDKNTQYLYTTSVDLGESGYLSDQKNNIPTGRNVYAVYRTILKWNSETGKWEAQKSELGYAESAWYDNNLLGSWVAKCPSFDPDTWQAGKQGTSSSNSVYTYVGQHTTAYVDSITEVAWYDLTPSEAGTRTVSSYNLDCTIKITNANGKTVYATSNIIKDADGKDMVSVSWNASGNTKYYIQISGDTSMRFTVS
ncbi:MAG: hypothetical protein J6B56_05735 [Clostridia bacterium]|nr:hypothetical protein [Clostridia bacterium]